MINYCYLTQLIDTSSASSKTYITSANVSKNFCRFCKKTEGLKFKKDAHVIPYSVGNKFYLHREECDSCNEFFSLYENSFSNHFSLYCLVNGISKRDGEFKKIKDYKNKNSIKYIKHKNRLEVEHIEFDKDNPTLMPLSFLQREPFCNKWHFLRVLLKISYTFLSYNELSQYEAIRKLIMSNDNEFIKNFKTNCCVTLQYLPAPVSEGIMLFHSPLFIYKNNLEGNLFILIIGKEVYTLIIFSHKNLFLSNNSSEELNIVYFCQDHLDLSSILRRVGPIPLFSDFEEISDSHFNREITVSLTN